MSDIEQRLREAMDGEETPAEEFSRLIIEVNEGDTQTRTEAWNLIADFACGHADTIIRGFSAVDTIASLRSKLEEAEGARDRLAKKIAACNWYWPEHETDSESCCESAQDVVQNAYDWSHEKTGDVVAVARGGVVEIAYCASLPPADDADSDDEFWVEEKTYEAAALKVADERARRTLASLREADHA